MLSVEIEDEKNSFLMMRNKVTMAKIELSV
jgi:hypothetical protein